MTDFLTRIAERTLGVARVAQPIIAPLFAPVPALSTSEPTFLSVDEVIESSAQMQKARRPNMQAVPQSPALVTRTSQPATYAPGQPIPDTTGDYRQPIADRPANPPVPSPPENGDHTTHVVQHSNLITTTTPSVLEQRHFKEENFVTPAHLISPSANLPEEVTTIKEQPTNTLPGGHIPLTEIQERHSLVPSEKYTSASHQGDYPFTSGRPIDANLTGEISGIVPTRGIPTIDERAHGAVLSTVRMPHSREDEGSLASIQGNTPTLSRQGIYIDETPIQHFAESSAPKISSFPSMEEHLLVPNQGDHQDHLYMPLPQNVGATLAVALEDSRAINQHTVGAIEVASPTPTIHVTIGRIDVRAITPPVPPTRSKPTRLGPTLSLEDYTRQNRGGR